MNPKSGNVQLEKRGAALAVFAVVIVSLYQALFFAAPEILAQPLWTGSGLTLAFLLGSLSLIIPVAVAWLIIRTDTADDETFDTSRH